MSSPPPAESETPSKEKRAEKSDRKLLKVVVKKRKKTKKSHPNHRSLEQQGLPKVLRGTQQHETATNTEKSLIGENETDRDQQEASLFDDLPCDTLLALRSLIASSQGLTFPLAANGSMVISCVLESQLHQKLESINGSDSVVTHELLMLIRENSVRRLPFSYAQSATTTMAIMETKDYIRGVWDAHQVQNNSNERKNQIITSWFVSNLSNWTGRTVSHEDLQRRWKDSSQYKNSGLSASLVVDTLVKMQVVQSQSENDRLYFWLPNWGKIVLKSMSDATNKVIRQIKRSHYKELSQNQLESQSYPRCLSGRFVLQHMLSEGIITSRKTPSGPFVKLST